MKSQAGPKVKCVRCEDIIQSKHRHDYVKCRCGAIFIDGGSDYLRMGLNSNDYKFLPVEVPETSKE